MLAALNRWFGRRPDAGSVLPEVAVDLATLDVARADRFPVAGPTPWLDRQDAPARIEWRLANGEITAEQSVLCRKWHADGYVVLKDLYPRHQLEKTWAAYASAITHGKIALPKRADGEIMKDERLLNSHFEVPEVREMLHDPIMVETISLLLGASALPFQTIMGRNGSEQKAHSDSIHMTTYPQSYLAANWIAFEDIHPESGPLIYYPGSHRLPYAYSKEVGISLEEGRKNYDAYHAKYEPFIQNSIASNNLQPAHFEAKAGDVLIWHANLLHGGSPRKNPNRSRQALVCHYFAKGCICYHDYSGVLSHLHKAPLPPLRRSWSRWSSSVLRHLHKTLPPPTPESPVDGEVEPEAPPRSRFDGDAYLEAHPDVAAAGVDPYEHYINHGLAEGRRLRP